MSLNINSTIAKDTPEALDEVVKEISKLTSTALTLTKKSVEVLITGLSDPAVMTNCMRIISFFISNSRTLQNQESFIKNGLLPILGQVPNDAPIATPSLITLIDDLMGSLEDRHIPDLVRSVFVKLVTVIADSNISYLPIGSLRLASFLIKEFFLFNTECSLEQLSVSDLASLLFAAMKHDDIFMQENLVTTLRKCHQVSKDLEEEVLELLNGNGEANLPPQEIVSRFRKANKQQAYLVPLRGVRFGKDSETHKTSIAYFGVSSLVYKIEFKVYEYSYKTIKGGKMSSTSFSFCDHEDTRIYLLFAAEFTRENFEEIWKDVRPLIKAAKNEVEQMQNNFSAIAYINLESRAQIMQEMTPTPSEASFRSVTPAPQHHDHHSDYEAVQEIEMSPILATPRIRQSPSINEELSPAKYRHSIELPSRSFAVTPTNTSDTENETEIGSAKAMFKSILDKLKGVVSRKKKTMKETATNQALIMTTNLQNTHQKDWNDLESQLSDQIVILQENISRWYEAAKRSRANFTSTLIREEKEFNDLRREVEKVAMEFKNINDSTAHRHSAELSSVEKSIREALESTNAAIASIPEDNAGLLSMLME